MVVSIYLEREKEGKQNLIFSDMNRFLSVLAKTIQKVEYKRARDYVMWTLLQNIKSLIPRSGDTFKESLQSISAIYSVSKSAIH